MVLLGALALPPPAHAQVAHVAAGQLREVTVEKRPAANRGGDLVNATLKLDIDYRYHASQLMGEPLVACNARLSNPRGRLEFRHGGQQHAVSFDKARQDQIAPYHLEYYVVYHVTAGAHAGMYFLRCDAGVPGHWAQAPMTVPGSPDWGNFLCRSAVVGPLALHPTADLLPDAFCNDVSGYGKRMSAAEAKAVFSQISPRDMVISLRVAALGIGFDDLIQAERKQLVAGEMSDRRRALLEGMRHQPGADHPEVQRIIGTALDRFHAAKLATTRLQVMQDALKAVFALKDEADALRRYRAELAARMDSGDERSAVERSFATLSALRDDGLRLAAERRERLDRMKTGEIFDFDAGGLVSPGLKRFERACNGHPKAVWYSDLEAEPCRFGPFLSGSEFWQGYAAVRLSRSEYGFLDSSGNLAFGMFRLTRMFRGGAAPVNHPDGRPGFITLDGAFHGPIVIEGDFGPDGFAVFSEGEERAKRMGIVASDGRRIVAATYLKAEVRKDAAGQTLFYLETARRTERSPNPCRINHREYVSYIEQDPNGRVLRQVDNDLARSWGELCLTGKRLGD